VHAGRACRRPRSSADASSNRQRAPRATFRSE
jgi:hypothetical protein